MRVAPFAAVKSSSAMMLRDLDLGMRLREVRPHLVVAVEHLLIGARAAVEDVRDVQLVVHAAGQQHFVAHREQDGVREDLLGEDARLAGHRRDVSGLHAEEVAVQIVHHLTGFRRGVEHAVHLRVEAREHVRVDEVVDDDDARVVQRGGDVCGGVAGFSLRDLDAHRSTPRESGVDGRARHAGPAPRGGRWTRRSAPAS